MRPPTANVQSTKTSFQARMRQDDQCGERKDHKEKIVVPQHSEGGAGVVNLDEIEKPWDDRNQLVGRNVREDERFRELIQNVEGQRDGAARASCSASQGLCDGRREILRRSARPNR